MPRTHRARRVALLGPWPPPYGGVQTHLVALRDGLRAAGAEVAVFNITRHRSVAGDGVHFPEGAGDLIRQLRAFAPNVVHVHLGGDLTTRLLALLIACRVLVASTVIVTIHSGGYPRSARAQQLGWLSLEGLVFRAMSHVIVVNRELKALFERLGVQPERVTELVPTLAVPTPAETLPEAVAGFVADAAPLIVTVGLLEDEYLLPLQLEALRALQQSHRNARMVIVGSGSREGQIRSAITAQGLDASVLLNGDTPHPITAALIVRAAVLWRITAYDGDSVSVREALALGTPVIATDNGMRPGGVHVVAAEAEAIAATTRSVLAMADAGRGHTKGPAGPSEVLSAHTTIVLTA